MSKAAFDKIAEGLTEALAVARGEAEPHRVWAMDETTVEAVARAIYDAPNGIDGDQVADMIIMDDRINGANAEECRAQVMAVCREAARAAIAAHEAALAAAGYVILPVATAEQIAKVNI